MTNFTHLEKEWPTIHEAALKAENSIYSDPRTACFYSRRALELFVAWLFKYDGTLKLPYQENLSTLIHEPTFKILVGDALFSKARLITKLGNQAVHSQRPIMQSDAIISVKELFHVAYWVAHTYARGDKPAPELQFNPDAVPKTAIVPKRTIDQLRQLESQLHEKDEKLSILLSNNESLDQELKKLRIEIAQAKTESAAHTDTHNYSEEETRDYFIDLLLKEAGWLLDQDRDREFQVSGMPNNKGHGFIDYVLWGDNGKPLGLVEAKRTKHDPRKGQRQAELYADCLEAQFGQRPIIFYSNGYKHWMWDNHNYPPREIQGFYTKQELELLVQRRTTRRALAQEQIRDAIAGRYYQTRAIRRVCEAFEQDKDRKALIVMATGAGKTRTVIALYDLLARCNWAKRVLFLADRVALVKQASNSFLKFLPDSSPVNLIQNSNGDGRVYVSTYPTMMGLIDETNDGLRRFGPGYFDLIIIDEAHRSVFQKYRAIFDYFDSLLVGLTATPKIEIDRNTYTLFNLENNVPTDAYELSEAIKDHFLVPPKSVSVPIRFQREGIKYDELSDEEKERWDEIDWDESGETPQEIDPNAINNWLFNQDTVDKVLAHLMTKGLKVAGGDRLGKTIVFAKNQAHANFIEERFNINYPHYRGEFARVITHGVDYAQSLIDLFSIKDKAPHIAISVDMLDTGIDVPEVVNLVFFKLVRSKTKFWQMVGRGTRLCTDLFEPDKHKEFFYIFDYCQNLEFFSQNPEHTDGTVGKSLSQRLFITRIDLIKWLKSAETDKEICTETIEILRKEIDSMRIDNFIVRTKRELVEIYKLPNSWLNLKEEDYENLKKEVSGLPSEMEPESEEAKRFDLLMLRIQLSILKNGDGFENLAKQVKKIASLLAEKSSIPMVNEQMSLILDIQSDEWWQDTTIQIMENARKRLRDLVKFIEKSERKIIYTNFEDDIGEGKEVILPIFDPKSNDHYSEAGNLENFRIKASAFLKSHNDHITIRKLRANLPLTAQDLQELERMFADNAIGDKETIEKVKIASDGLGLFVRSLVGLDREAAKQALAGFLKEKVLSANQLEFINLIIDHLTAHGVMDAKALYESPFTDIHPIGPEGIFSSREIDELVIILNSVKETALVA